MFPEADMLVLGLDLSFVSHMQTPRLPRHQIFYLYAFKHKHSPNGGQWMTREASSLSRR